MRLWLWQRICSWCGQARACTNRIWVAVMQLIKTGDFRSAVEWGAEALSPVAWFQQLLALSPTLSLLQITAFYL
jgi:hypothetical protein